MQIPRLPTNSTRDIRENEGVFSDSSGFYTKKSFYVAILAISFTLTMVIVIPASTASSRKSRMVPLPTNVPLHTPTSSPVAESLSVVSSVEDNFTAESTPTSTPTSAPVSGKTTSEPAKATTQTLAPVTAQKTSAPIAGSKPTTTQPPVQAPVSKSTSAPVKQPTRAPVKPLTAAPVKTPTKAPVKPPTKAPSAAPVVVGPPTLPPLAPSTFKPIRINSGGIKTTVNENGKIWYTDKQSIEHVEILGDSSVYDTPCELPEHDDLYCSERWFQKDGGYNVRVPNGDYMVSLSFVEIFHDEAADRIFNILVEGKIVRRKYDILKAAGGEVNKLRTENFKTTVADGMLSVELRKVKQHPKISALEITRISS